MENRKPRCYNCQHASRGFKIGKLTYHHCFNPIHTNEDTSPWDSLRVFSDSCKDHEFKPKKV